MSHLKHFTENFCNYRFQNIQFPSSLIVHVLQVSVSCQNFLEENLKGVKGRLFGESSLAICFVSLAKQKYPQKICMFFNILPLY